MDFETFTIPNRRRWSRQSWEILGFSLLFLGASVFTAQAILASSWFDAGIGFSMLGGVYCLTRAKARERKWTWSNRKEVFVDFGPLRRKFPQGRIGLDVQRDQVVGVVVQDPDPAAQPDAPLDWAGDWAEQDEVQALRDRALRISGEALAAYYRDGEVSEESVRDMILDPEARFLGDVLSGKRGPGGPSLNTREVKDRVRWLRNNSETARRLFPDLFATGETENPGENEA